MPKTSSILTQHDHVLRQGMFFFKLFCLLVLTLSLEPQTAHADKTPQPGKVREIKDAITGFHGEVDIAGAYQGLGLILRARYGHKWRLYSSSSAALKDNFFMFGALAQVSPAMVNAGAYLTIQPLTIFTLQAQYYYRAHFPTFTSGTLFKDAAAIKDRFANTKDLFQGDDALDAQKDQSIKENNGRPFVTGHFLSASATFRIKISKIIFLANANLGFHWLDFKDVNNSQFIYEPIADMITHKNDTLLDLTGLLAYDLDNILILLLNSYTYAFGSEATRWLLGPGIRWTITKKALGFKEPYLVGLVRFYISHRWRTNPPIPNIAIVFGASF